MNQDDVSRAASAGGRAGGAVQIHVTMDPSLRASIINDSVENAVVRVGYELQQDGQIREGVRSISK